MENQIIKKIKNNNEILKLLNENDDVEDVIFFSNGYHIYKSKKLIPISDYLRFKPQFIQNKVSKLLTEEVLSCYSKLGKNEYKCAVRIGCYYFNSIIVDKHGIKTSGRLISEDISKADLYKDRQVTELPKHLYQCGRLKGLNESSVIHRLSTKFDVSPQMIGGEIFLNSKTKEPLNVNGDASLLFMSGSIDEFELVSLMCSTPILARELIGELELLSIDF